VNHRTFACRLAAFSLLPAAAAWAQTAPPAQRVEITGQAVRAADSLPLDKPASSGSRLGLTALETPASVDVITSELMRERGDRTTQDALENAAGVVAGQCFGLTCFSVRGFSGTLSLPFLFDGLRYPGLAFSPRGTFVFDRIEVIKGPSSVLHGLGSVTGAVNFVTKPADGKSERELFLAYDRWATKNVGLGLGGGAADGVAYRFDVNVMDADKGSAGWVDRSGYTYVHGAGEVAWRISPALRVSLSAQALDDDGQWYFGTPLVAGKIDERVRFNNYNVSDSQMRKRATWLRGNVDYDIAPGLKLRNETYSNDEKRIYKNAEVTNFNAGTGRVDLSDFLNIVHDQELLGNRTELTADQRLGGMRNRVIVGLDWSRNKHKRTNNSPYASPAVSVDFLNPVPVAFVTTSPYSPQRRTVVDSKAVFAEDLLSLTEQAKLSLSYRHDSIDLDSFNLRDGTSFDKHWSANSWRVGMLYDLTPMVTAYAQLSRAYEPPAQVVTLTPAQRSFNLTRARQAEIGLKGFLPGRVGEFTLAYFNIVRNDILTRDPNAPAATIQIGQQSSRGIEFDVAWRPLAGWALGVNGTWLKAQYDVFNESVGGVAVSRAGLLPPDTPERVGNVFVTWRPTAELRLHGSVRRVGARSTNNANTVFMPAYTTGDLSAGYKLPVGEVAVKLRNITDKVYGSRSYGTGDQVLLGEPRAVEVSYAVKF
jgi:iron complex outermembrane receptor protein